MAKTGYLFLAKGYKAREEDIAWMKEFGCESIVIEEGVQERLRPQWRRLLTLLKKNDEIVVTSLSNYGGKNKRYLSLQGCTVV